MVRTYLGGADLSGASLRDAVLDGVLCGATVLDRVDAAGATGTIGWGGTALVGGVSVPAEAAFTRAGGKVSAAPSRRRTP